MAEQVEAALAAAEAALGPIDILVNNAGLTRDNILLRLTDADWDAVLDANLKGAFHTTRAVIKGMMKRRSGRIINITSIVGPDRQQGPGELRRQQGGPDRLHQVGRQGVRQPRHPGQLHRPGLHRNRHDRRLARGREGHIITGHRAWGAWDGPRTSPGPALFLASDLAAYITGQVLVVDGGLVI